MQSLEIIKINAMSLIKKAGFGRDAIPSITLLLRSADSFSDLKNIMAGLLAGESIDDKTFIENFLMHYQPGIARQITLTVFGERRTKQDLIADALIKPDSATALAVTKIQLPRISSQSQI